MSSTEDYLDSLLRSVMSPAPKQEPEPEPEPEPEEPKVIIAEETVDEEPVNEEPVIEELIIEESVYEQPVAEEAAYEEPVFDMSMLEEPVAEETAYEEPVFDMSMLEEPVAEEAAYEEPTFEEPVLEEPLTEDVSYEEPSLDDLLQDNSAEEEDISDLLKSIGEMGTPFEDEELPAVESEESFNESEEGTSFDEINIDEIDVDGINVDETAEGEINLDEINIDDINLDEMNSDSMNFSNENLEEMDLNSILSEMEDDSELSEIGNLLNMETDSVLVDESIMNENGDDSDFTFPEETEETEVKDRKRKKKGNPFLNLFKKKKNQTEDTEDTEESQEEIILESLDETEGDEPTEPQAEPRKKAGFFSNIMDSLTKEVEDEPESQSVFEESAVDFAQETAAENKKLLEEAEADEDDSKADKKGKKEKKKKEKKEKKKKEKPQADLLEDAGYRKLPKKKIIVICILCFSLGIVITLVTYLVPYYRDSEKAQSSYDHGDYVETYTALKGHNLNKKQQELYNKTLVIMKVKRKLDSYENYMQMGMPAQALDALLQGLKNATDYASYAEELGITDQFNAFKAEIEEKVQSSFGLDLDQAYEWSQIEDPQLYSKKIYQYLVQKSGISLDGQSTQNDLSENPIISGEEEEFSE